MFSRKGRKGRKERTPTVDQDCLRAGPSRLGLRPRPPRRLHIPRPTGRPRSGCLSGVHGSIPATACVSHASSVSIRFPVHTFFELRHRPKNHCRQRGSTPQFQCRTQSRTPFQLPFDKLEAYSLAHQGTLHGARSAWSSLGVAAGSCSTEIAAAKTVIARIAVALISLELLILCRIAD